MSENQTPTQLPQNETSVEKFEHAVEHLAHEAIEDIKHVAEELSDEIKHLGHDSSSDDTPHDVKSSPSDGTPQPVPVDVNPAEQSPAVETSSSDAPPPPADTPSEQPEVVLDPNFAPLADTDTPTSLDDASSAAPSGETPPV